MNQSGISRSSGVIISVLARLMKEAVIPVSCMSVVTAGYIYRPENINTYAIKQIPQ